MSQFKFDIAHAQYPLDAFATVTVASTAGYVIGELAGNGTVSGKITRIVDATRLVLTHVKGGITMAGTLTGVTSTTASAISAFSWGQPRTRDVNGVLTEKVFGAITIDDMGVHMKTRADDSNSEFLSVSTRLALSKIQNTDTSVAPTLVYTVPAAGTYVAGMVMTFEITSNEALALSGANFPRVAVSDATPVAPVVKYATYVPEKSNSMRLVFEWHITAQDILDTTAGQIASIAYDANTNAVITDIGGGAVVPNWSGATITGILLG